MKTTVKFFLVIFSIVLLLSCESEVIPNSDNSEDIKLKSSEEYKYDFNILRDYHLLLCKSTWNHSE